MKKTQDRIIYYPSDLIRYVASPFASWMDRYYVENPEAVTPDKETDDQKLIAETGNEHERVTLAEFKALGIKVVEIPKDDSKSDQEKTVAAIKAKTPIIYQAALADDRFCWLRGLHHSRPF